MTSPGELRSYGFSMALMCGVFGGLLRFQWGLPAASVVVWIAGGALLLVAAVAPTSLRPAYRGWMILTWPLRWSISHAALAAVFFLVLTPIGWVLRCTRHDPLRIRKLQPAAEQTFWTEVKTDDRPERAFQQF